MTAPTQAMEWLNAPQLWEADANGIRAVSLDATDFWRETHYGFVHDNGHFYHRTVSGDFTARLCITGGYQHLYDQCGLMIRLDARHWIKTGIEFVNGRQNLSAVVTRDFSDWSVLPLDARPTSVWLRLTRRATAISIEYALDGKDYRMLRLAYLPFQESIQVGPMLCSPQRAGFVARFTEFHVGPPSESPLYS